MFMPMRNRVSCLAFDITVEYVVRSRYGSMGSGTMLEVIGVMPSSIENLTKNKKAKIQVKFNKEFDLDDLDLESSEVKKLFYLENMVDKDNKVYPNTILEYDLETLTLFFNFKGIKLPEKAPNNKDELCYTLKVGNSIIQPITLPNKYCFKH